MVNEKSFSLNIMHIPVKLRNPSTSKVYLKVLKDTKYNTGTVNYWYRKRHQIIQYRRHFPLLIIEDKIPLRSLMLPPLLEARERVYVTRTFLLREWNYL
jgi:hypothetical protein